MTEQTERTRTVVLLPGGKPKCSHCAWDISDGGYEVAGRGDDRREVLCADCLAPRVTEVRDHRGLPARVERVEVLAEGERDHLPTRERDVVLAMGRKGWTVEKVSYPDHEAWVEGRARVEGESVAYGLSPDGDEWHHGFDGLGVEYGVQMHSSAGRVASPEDAWRALAAVAESGAYWYLSCYCARGEEPDQGAVERLAERARREGWTSRGDTVVEAGVGDSSGPDDVTFTVRG